MMIAKAIAFAADAHCLQHDKNGEAYILHPLRVASSLREAQYSETYQLVALLHDTVEDTETTIDQIYKHFGSLVAEAVEAMTRRKKDSGEQAETYKAYIKRCCSNPIARVVKRFDVYDNLDPRRYCDGVPVSRYAWALEYLAKNERDRERVNTEVC